MRIFIIIINIILIIILSFFIQRHDIVKSKIESELMYFPSGQYITQLALEYRSVIADILWLEAIQYYGYHRLNDLQFKYLYKIFDVITDLNPYFIQCYVFGGTLITYDQKEPELGMKLIKKGLLNMPDSWRIPFIRGFLYYVYLRDYNAAYVWFKYASTKKDAPKYCKRFAAASLQRKGDYITSLKMWSVIYKESINDYEKQTAKTNIISIINIFLNTELKNNKLKYKINFIKNEIKKYDFLPFDIDISVKGDSIIVKEIK